MQTEETRKYLDRIAEAPSDLSAYEALERIYTRGSQWRELIDLYRQKAPHLSEVGEKRLLWQKIARLAEEILDEPGLAIESGREILPPAGLDRTTLKAIEGLCRRHRRWESLRDFLEIAGHQGEERAEALAALHRLGELYCRELADIPKALLTFDEVLSREPRHPEAIRAAESLLAEPVGRASAAEILERAYRSTSSWDDLFDLYDRLLQDEKDPGTRVDLLGRRAALIEERRGPEAAFPEFAKAFLEAGRHEAIQGELERIAARSGLWRDLLTVYLRSLDRTQGDAVSNQILLRAAEIAEENLGLKAVAERCYRQLLDFEPGHGGALGALERIYTESGDDAALLGILERRATRTQDSAALAELLRRSGEIAEHRLSRPVVSIDKYEALLVLDPDDPEAKEALLRLYPRAGRWRDLVEHLLREAKPAETVSVRRRVAEICEEKIGDLAEAIVHQEEILRVSPGDPRALEDLTRLYGRAGKPDKLLAVLEQRATAASDPAERWALRLQIAEVYRKGLRQRLQAADLYGEVVHEAKGEAAGEAARRALEALLSSASTRARAASILERFYVGSEAWQRLVDVYDRVLPALQSSRERSRALQAVAHVYERKLQSPERAYWAHGRALKEHPSSPRAESELLRLAGELHFHDELAGLLEDAYEVLTGERPPATLETAVPEAPPAEPVEGEDSTNVVEAVQILDESELVAEEITTEASPAMVEAAEAPVAEIKEEEVIEVEEEEDTAGGEGPPIVLEIPFLEVEPEAAEEPAPETALRFALQLARLHEEVLGRREAAALWYRRVRGLDPNHRQALEALDRLAVERGDDEELREILRARVERVPDAAREVELRLRLGTLLEAAFADLEGAIAEYRAALRALPASAKAFAALEVALEAAERPADLADLYRGSLRRSPSREVSLKLARVLLEALQNPEGSLEVLRPLLKEDPRDAEALRAFEAAALEAGYDQDERAQDLLPVLEALRDLAAEPEQWRERERRLGEILETALGRTAEAVERYARVLREDGDDARAREALERLARASETRGAAARVLEPYYRQREEWGPLTDLLSLELVDAEARSARAALHAEIARIAEEHRGDHEAAFRAYSQALGETPADFDTLEAVDRLAAELGYFEEFCALLDETAEALEREAGATGDRVHVLRRLAQVSAMALGDRPRALQAYRAALDLQPENVEIFRAVEDLLAHLERWRDLAELFRAALRREPENRAYALRLADLLEVILESPEEALDVLREMLRRNPRDLEALRAFEGVFTRADLDRTTRAGELIPVLEALEEHAKEPAQKRDYEFRVGKILELSLRRPEEAVPRYGRVLAEEPEHERALDCLERLSLIPSCRPAACAILERHYRARREYAPLVAVQERSLEDLLAPAERAQLLAEVGQIQEEHLDDRDASFGAYARAFRERPGATALLDAVERLGLQLERHQELTVLLEAGATALEDPAAEATVGHRVRLLILLATLYAETIGDASLAIHGYERALALDPAREVVFNALEGLYSREGRYPDLAGLYRGRIGREPKDQATVLKLARVLDEVLDDSSAALDVLRAYLQRAPKDLEAMRAFDRIFTRAHLDRGKGAAELLPILVALRDAAKGTEAREYEFRAGALRELSLEEPAAAVPHYAAVLQADVTHARAREALERLLRRADTRPAVAEVLEPYYREQADWRPLVDLLELRAGDARAPKARAQILFEVGRIHEEKLSDAAAAFEASARAFAAAPAERAMLGAVERLATDLGKFGEFAELLTNAAAALEEAPKGVSVEYRVGVLQRLAATSATVLGDNERAIDAYNRALDLDPENDTTLIGLDRLYTMEGRARDLATILEREIERSPKAPDRYDRLDLLRRLARVREEIFGDLDGATEAYEELRRAAAGDAEAAGSLERLYEATSRWRDLAELLLEMAPIGAAGHDRLLEAARLLEERVHDYPRASEIYARLRETDPEDRKALSGLERVLGRPELVGREAELLEVLEALEAAAGDERSRADLIYRQGALLAGALRRPGDAVERLSRVLELRPGHREALLALEDLAQVPAVRDLAVPRLETYYERAGSWQALVDLYETLLEGKPPQAKRELLRKMAEIYERELRNPRLAFREYARLFGEEPQVRAHLDTLERLAEEMGSYERLANLYDEFLRDIPDRELGLDLTLRLAHLYEETLGRKALAIDRYRHALELDPSSAVALNALDRIFGMTEEWIELQKVLRRKLELAHDYGERAGLYCRIGTLFESKMGLAGAAVDAFESAMELAPDDEAPLAALERIFAQRADLVLRNHIADTLRPLYAARGNRRQIAALGLGIAEVTPLDDREPMLLQAVRAYEELGEGERAFRILLEGLGQGCHSEATLTALERLAAPAGHWTDLCRGVDQAALSLAEDDPVREALTLRAAKWYWDRLSDPAGAEQRYTWVFLRDPAASPAFRSLEAIHTAVFDADKLLDLCRRRLAVVRDKEERALLLKRAGDLGADFLGRPDEAMQAYEESLRLKPDDPQVLDALAPLYEQSQRFQDLSRILERKLTLVPDGERFDLHRRIAEIWGAEIGDDEQAIRHYRSALDLAPKDLELWRALRWHCARAEHWSELSEALQRELELMPEAAGRVALARELANVEEERLGRPDRAADALAELLKLEPGDLEAWRRYERLLTKTERWADLAASYEGRLAGGGSLEERARLLGALASLAERELGDLPRATVALEQLCEAKPDDLNALRELARLYEAQNRFKECFDFFKAQVKRVGEAGAVAVELLCRMGLLCEERAKNLDVAERCYRRALALDAKCPPALQGLRRVYQQRGEPALVAQALEAEAELVQGEERAVLAIERAKIMRDQVKDVAQAAAAFEVALRAAPGSADAAQGYVDLLDKGLPREAARGVLPMLVEIYGKTRRIRDRHLGLHKLGHLAESLGNTSAALAAFEAAYQASSTHLPTMLSLGRLYYDAGHWEKALKMLQILLLNEGSLPTPADRVELFYRLGSIRQKMGERARAINMFQRALEIDPKHGPSRKVLNELLGG
jgi:tetratricopeptide (TPR) repeat protein